MAFQSFFVNAAGLLNQFAWPIAIKEIQWKTYIIFVVWTFIQGVLAYFFFPETRKRTVSLLLFFPFFLFCPRLALLCLSLSPYKERVQVKEPCPSSM